MKKLVVSTTEYVVQDRDTIERIAAKFDCTPSQLTKLNKLTSRVLFTGQTIFVPDGTYVEEVVEEPPPPAKNDPSVTTSDENVQVLVSKEPNESSVDVECMQRFFKLHTDRLLAGGQKVSGVLIITPSCAMFDPDADPVEPVERVQDKFGMVASVEEVLCVALYEECCNAEGNNDKEVSEEKSSPKVSPKQSVESSTMKHRYSAPTEKSIQDDVVVAVDPNDSEAHPVAIRSSTFDSSTIVRPSLSVTGTVLEEGVEHQFHRGPSGNNDRRRSSFAAGYENKESSRTLSPLVIRRKLSSGIQKLRDSWRSSDSDKDANANAATKQRKSSPCSPRLTGGDCSSLSLSGAPSYEDLYTPGGSPNVQKQKEYFDALETLKQKTLDLRSNLPRFYDAMQRMDSLSLKSTVSAATADSRSSSQQIFCLRICTHEKRSTNGSNHTSAPSENLPSSTTVPVTKDPKSKVTIKEFWYRIPYEKIDVLYLLFLQWCAREEIKPTDTLAQDIRFLVLDEVKYVDRSSMDKNSQSIPVSLENLRFNWELIALNEYKRRFSLNDLTESFFLPLPEGASESQLLDEPTIRRLVGVLPARAQSYPWVLIYSSHAHGFSLRTMYHKTARWSEETSPSLLVIKDSNQRVFGAVVSCILRVAEHFYGSGESLLFTTYPTFRAYNWTGANHFVVKGSVDSLAIGAGRGTFGLYLDADFYHGRTQRCDTFGNEPLTDSDDFTIVGVEVFGFSINL